MLQALIHEPDKQIRYVRSWPRHSLAKVMLTTQQLGFAARAYFDRARACARPHRRQRAPNNEGSRNLFRTRRELVKSMPYLLSCMHKVIRKDYHNKTNHMVIRIMFIDKK